MLSKNQFKRNIRLAIDIQKKERVILIIIYSFNNYILKYLQKNARTHIYYTIFGSICA